MFSKACEYGIRATIYIALQSQQNKRVSLKDISKQIGSPEAFTAKILQVLAKNQIIESLKGPTGGFIIRSEKMELIKLADIVGAIDGNNIFSGCGLGLEHCSDEQPCPLHFNFKRIKNDLKLILDNTSLSELAIKMNEGNSFLKIDKFVE